MLSCFLEDNILLIRNFHFYSITYKTYNSDLVQHITT
jgi:hypothetical protein